MSFDVRPGEIFGLLGPNGAGKTTLIRLLGGLAFADGGYLEMLGSPVPRDLAAVIGRVAFVASAPRLYPHLTPLQNMRVFARLKRVTWSRSTVDELLASLDLETVRDRRVRILSSGMRQRLALAVALLGSPDVLILDEPTTGLDPVGLRDVRHILSDFVADGRAVLLSSHQLREVELLCERVLLLREGRTHRYGRLDDLLPPVSTFSVVTRNPARAVDALRGGGLSARIDGRRIIVTDAEPDMLVRCLVRARQYPEELSPVVPPIESLFIDAHHTDSDVRGS